MEITKLDNKLQKSLSIWMSDSLSIRDCVNSKPMNRMIKIYGEDNMILAISAVVLKELDNFNDSKKMTNEQIALFAKRFLTMFKFESVTDLAVCLQNASMGIYGSENKSYNSIDSSVIMGWFKLHLDQKYEEVETLHKKVKKQDPLKPSGLSEEGKAAISQILNYMEEEKKKKREEEFKNRKEKSIPLLSNFSDWWSYVLENISTFSIDDIKKTIITLDGLMFKDNYIGHVEFLNKIINWKRNGSKGDWADFVIKD